MTREQDETDEVGRVARGAQDAPSVRRLVYRAGVGRLFDDVHLSRGLEPDDRSGRKQDLRLVRRIEQQQQQRSRHERAHSPISHCNASFTYLFGVHGVWFEINAPAHPLRARTSRAMDKYVDVMPPHGGRVGSRGVY